MLFPSLLLAQALVASAATADQWRGRSVYQVLTDRFARPDGSTTAPCDPSDQVYCGGTWQGLINKLDYIKGMGFSAVWISPVTHQTAINNGSESGQPYHGYWQDDLYAVNPAFGSSDDLKALSKALHDNDMYLMVDVVANHFSWNGPHTTVNFSIYNPFNSADDFHSFCQLQNSDYNDNQTAVEDCWIGNDINQLTDVNTNSDSVKAAYKTWIQQLVANYSIDGLRIDTVRNVQPDFWGPFVSAAGVYAVGEVFNGNLYQACPYQSYLGSTSAGILNYPAYFSITNAFSSTTGNMTALANTINGVKSTCNDSTLLGSFVENHDNPRFPNLTSDIALDQNAIAFALLADGIPILYQGQEQHYAGGNDPANREALWLSGYNTGSTLYNFVAKINSLRNAAIAHDPGYTTYQAWPIYTDTTTIAMRKGSNSSAVIGVFSNKGSQGANYTQNIPQTGYVGGSQVVEVVSCQNYTANADGSLDVNMANGAVRVFYPAQSLAGSGVCQGNAGRMGGRPGPGQGQGPGYWPGNGDGNGNELSRGGW